ncbi:hypothetical protein XH80_28905 [Bradyrhizobium sp. CCBAU 45384]|nr:hypothetical protein [Bradyrhizobium sp. CCBAU 45384]
MIELETTSLGLISIALGSDAVATYQMTTILDRDQHRSDPARGRMPKTGEGADVPDLQMAMPRICSRSIDRSRAGQSFRPSSDFSIRTAFRSELWTSIFPL